MTCVRCGSTNVSVQAVAMQKKRGCFMSLIWLILGVMTIGLVWLIPLFTKKGSKVKGFAVCQDCGKQWKAR